MFAHPSVVVALVFSLQAELRDVQEEFRCAMAENAGLEGQVSQLTYEVITLCQDSGSPVRVGDCFLAKYLGLVLLAMQPRHSMFLPAPKVSKKLVTGLLMGIKNAMI